MGILLKGFKENTGGVLLEMMLSVTALVLLFSGMMNISYQISRQNTINAVIQEIETLLRGSSLNSDNIIPDTNKDIRSIHSDLNLVVQKIFTSINEDLSNYTFRAGVFAYEMPKSKKPIFYLWLGIQGKEEHFISARPCSKMMVPVEINYGDSYVIDLPGSADPEIIIPTTDQALSNIPNDSDAFSFFEADNIFVTQVINEFCQA